jgi:hypothetical protein
MSERLAEIQDRVGEIAGHLNALHAELAVLTAEVDDGPMLGGTGLKGTVHWLCWQAGLAPATARRVLTMAQRASDLPEITKLFQDGLLSLDQASTVAARIPAELDSHFAEMAPLLTVTQLRTAIRVAVPRPAPKSEFDDEDPQVRDVTSGFDDDGQWFVRGRADAAAGAPIENAWKAHYQALVHAWEAVAGNTAPYPTWFDALERMADRSMAKEAFDRPWSDRTRVVVHVDLEKDLAQLHLGPNASCCSVTPPSRRSRSGSGSRSRTGGPIGSVRTSSGN